MTTEKPYDEPKFGGDPDVSGRTLPPTLLGDVLNVALAPDGQFLVKLQLNGCPELFFVAEGTQEPGSNQWLIDPAAEWNVISSSRVQDLATTAGSNSRLNNPGKAPRAYLVDRDHRFTVPADSLAKEWKRSIYDFIQDDSFFLSQESVRQILRPFIRDLVNSHMRQRRSLASLAGFGFLAAAGGVAVAMIVAQVIRGKRQRVR